MQTEGFWLASKPVKGSHFWLSEQCSVKFITLIITDPHTQTQTHTGYVITVLFFSKLKWILFLCKERMQPDGQIIKCPWKIKKSVCLQLICITVLYLGMLLDKEVFYYHFAYCGYKILQWTQRILVVSNQSK